MNNNIFDNLPTIKIGEIFQEILFHKNVKIEKIISSDSPDSTIYEQEQDEWVLLLEGKATLAINNQLINLEKGDYLYIPAHTPHQVIKTSSQPLCIWLAIHIY